MLCKPKIIAEVQIIRKKISDKFCCRCRFVGKMTNTYLENEG